MVLEEIAVELPQHLGDLIRGTEVQRHKFFGEGQGGVAAVDGAARGGVDEALHPGQVGILGEFQGSQAIHQKVGLGVVNGVLIGEQGGQVKNDLRAFKKNPLQLNFIEDAAFHKQNIRRGSAHSSAPPKTGRPGQ